MTLPSFSSIDDGRSADEIGDKYCESLDCGGETACEGTGVNSCNSGLERVNAGRPEGIGSGDR